jgi:integrase
MFKRGNIYYERIGGKKVSLHSGNLKQAKKKLRELEKKEDEEGGQFAGYKMPLDKLVNLFLSSALPMMKQSSQITYTSNLKGKRGFLDRFAEFGDGRCITKVCNITELRVQEEITKMLNQGNHPGNINSKFVAVRSMYKWAQKMKIISPLKNPFASESITFPAKSKGKDRILTADEERRFLEQCSKSKHNWLLDVVTVALLTGFRRTNTIEIEWSWIDFSSRSITVPWQRYKRFNGDQSDHVSYMPDRIMELMERRYKKYQGKSKFVFPSIPPEGDYNHSLDYSKHLHSSTYYKSFKKAVKAASINGDMDDITPHTMRHDFGTKATTTFGNNVIHAQKMLGHASIRSTQRYVHPTTEDINEAHSRAFDKPKLQVVPKLSQRKVGG